MDGVAPEGAPALWLLYEVSETYPGQIIRRPPGRSPYGMSATVSLLLRSLSTKIAYLLGIRVYFETIVSCDSYLVAKALPRVLQFLTDYYSMYFKSCQGGLSICAKISEKLSN